MVRWVKNGPYENSHFTLVENSCNMIVCKAYNQCEMDFQWLKWSKFIFKKIKISCIKKIQMHFFSTLDLMWAYVMFYNIYFGTMMLFIFFKFTYKFCIHVIKKCHYFKSPLWLFYFISKNSFIFSIQLKSIVTWIIF
jgi:hypothetical protein